MPALIAVSILWAFSFGLIKGQLTNIDASLVAAIRLSLCALVFLPWLKPNITTKQMISLLGLGAIQFGVMYWAYIQSYQYLPGYLVAVFTIFTPLYVMLIAAAISKQRLLTTLLPVMLSIVGAAIIVFKAPNAEHWFTGFAILQVANIAFAFGQVSYQKMARQWQTSHLSNMSFMYIGAMIFSVPIAIVNNQFSDLLAINETQWLSLLYLEIIASGIGFCLWNYGAKQVSADKLAIMNNGYIPFAVLFSFTLFGENVDILRLSIGAIVLASSLYWCHRLVSNQE